MARRLRPRPDEYARGLAVALDKARHGVVSGQVTIQRLVSTVVNESGWSKRSPQNVARIAAALADACVYPDVDITDLRVPWKSWVRLSGSSFPARRMSRILVAERPLNRFLADYHRTTFATEDGLSDLTFVSSEKRVKYQGGELRIDLLFRDSEGTLVAVETERGDPQENSAFQLRRYLDALSAAGHNVRGVLITARPRSAQLEEDVLEELREIPYPTAWYWYDVSIGLERLDSVPRRWVAHSHSR